MPRKSKIHELILREVERGSLIYFKKLEDDWPTDAATAKRALSALLGHLKLELIPQIKPESRLENLEKGAIENISRSLATIKVLPIACKFFETRPDQESQEMLGMFECRRDGVFGWIRFLVRNVASLLPDPDDPTDLPLATIAVMLKSLIQLCRKHSIEYHLHQVMMEISLEIWIAGAERQNRYPSLDVLEYYRAAVPVLQLFSECIAEPPFDAIVINRINHCRGRSWTRRLANAFILHSQQYAAAYRNYSDTSQSTHGLVSLLAASRLLAGARRFYQLLTEEYKFPSVILKLAFDLSMALSEPGDASLAISVVAQALRPQGPNAYEHTHVLPQLLAAGYLTIVVLDLSYIRELGAYPFKNWPCADPLAQLYIACFHPRVSSAVKTAIDKIPPALLDKITQHPDPDVSQTWDNFTYGLGLYSVAYGGAQTGYIDLCDNLLHYQSPPREHGEGSVECSWCHSAVYCSARCQREDWNFLHRHECSEKRIRRIKLQLSDSWISNRRRFQLFRFSAVVFHDASFGPGPASVASKTRVRSLLSGPGILWVDTADFPIQWCTLSKNQFSALSHGGQLLFDDPRSQALIESWVQNDTVRLVGSIGRLGEFVVVTLATFLLRLEDANEVVEDPKFETLPLHIIVKVVTIVDEEVLWTARDISSRTPRSLRINSPGPAIS